MSALTHRIITALVLAAGLLYTLFALDVLGFASVFLIAFLLAAHEWSHLAGFSGQISRLLYTGGVAAILIGGAKFFGLPAFDGLQLVPIVLGCGAVWWLLALMLVLRYPAMSGLWGSRVTTAVMGLFVLVPACLGLVWLRAQPDGLLLVLYVIAIVASADIGAFFVGRQFGKHKLAPSVSPGKSIEGFIGGLAFCTLLAAGSMFHFTSVSKPLFLLLTLVAALASVLGDLAESMVKRHRGVKDSGRILPGHGGVLDRIDSLTAAAPVFALGWYLIG